MLPPLMSPYFSTTGLLRNSSLALFRLVLVYNESGLVPIPSSVCAVIGRASGLPLLADASVGNCLLSAAPAPAAGRREVPAPCTRVEGDGD